jgi:hypothetical protein
MENVITEEATPSSERGVGVERCRGVGVERCEAVMENVITEEATGIENVIAEEATGLSRQQNKNSRQQNKVNSKIWGMHSNLFKSDLALVFHFSYKSWRAGLLI